MLGVVVIFTLSANISSCQAETPQAAASYRIHEAPTRSG
ncbi:hypothetical protein QF031_000938 [Pseudarthrobacter defluvii]|nr:hypothetical protein [Pseudarthrobacter defluvii]